MASINMPQKRDPLDTLVKGLQIAQAGFGIYSDYKKLQQMNKAEDDAATAEENKKAGVIDKATAASLIGSGRYQQVDPNTPKAIGFQVETEQGRQPLWLAAAAPKTEQGMTEYQKAQLALAQKRLDLDAKKLAREGKPPVLGGDPTALKGAEEKKRFDGIVMGYKAVDDMAKAMQGGSNTFSLIGDNDFTMARRSWEEAIGRLQSGGAINKDEEARFRAMVPTIMDSAEIQAQKLNAMKEEMLRRSTTMGFDENALISHINKSKPAAAMAVEAPKLGGAGTAMASPVPAQQSQPEDKGRIDRDRAAIKWARENPNSPYAQEILKRNGVK